SAGHERPPSGAALAVGWDHDRRRTGLDRARRASDVAVDMAAARRPRPLELLWFALFASPVGARGARSVKQRPGAVQDPDGLAQAEADEQRRLDAALVSPGEA